MKVSRKLLALLLSFSLFSFFTCSSQISAVLLADSLTDRTEIDELRTSNSKTYQLNDGSYECVCYAEDIHYIDKNGDYSEIDNSIIDENSSSQYKYKNASNSWTVSFADHLTENNAVLIQKDDQFLSFKLRGGNVQSSAHKTLTLTEEESEYYKEMCEDNRAVIYQDVLNNIDIVYSVRSGEVKEDIVIKEHVDNNTFDFVLDYQGVLPSQEGNNIVFRNSSGSEVFQIGKLYLVDSNGKYSEEVDESIFFENGTAVVRITVSEEYLNAEDTAYPVIIDPSTTVTGSSNTYDTCVDEQYPSSNYYTSQNLWTGGQTGTNTMRTYIKFDIPSSVTSSVTRATLKVKKNAYSTPSIKAYRVTSSWSSSTVTWNNKPGYTTTGATGTCSVYSGDWYQMDATALVYAWKNGINSNYGFLLKEPSESNSSQKTRWYSSDAPSPNKPELVIRYVNAYGSRAYQSITTSSINCMGYALEYNSYIYGGLLGISESAMSGMTTSQMLNYIAGKSETWMNNNLGSGGYYVLSAYDSSIYTSSPGWFRVVLRVGFVDSDGDGKFDVGEDWDYHWWFQTCSYQSSVSYGMWAQKMASNASTPLTGSNGLDPAASPWMNGNLAYNSAGKYYQIKDSRSL